VHALLARVEERELAVALELFFERPYFDGRASRMSECGGKIFQARSSAL
jgi:hypothetical protein